MDLSIEVRMPNTPLTRGEASNIVAEEMTRATETGLNMVLQSMLPLVPIDRGLLRGGFQTQLLPGPTGILGRVFNPLAHALPQEAGAKPHFPPIAALEGWVRRKLSVAEKDVRSVAFLVARAIAKRGLPAREFAKRGVEMARPRVLQAFAQARARIVARLGGS